MTLWAGRVGRALDPAVAAFLRAEDAELLPYDCEATAVHARRLHGAGLLDDAELVEVESRLAEIASGGGIEPDDEDVHTAIERLLGDVGRKIHAGRSRNDQVAAAFRLYVADAAGEARAAIAQVAGVLLDRAEADAETPMPGYTHLQRAQPVTVGHHLLAWVEMLERDLTRFTAAADAARPSPLGAGALAGSTLPLPAPANQLRNSLDAVADRDFALDYLYAAAVCFVHLSRIGEEVILWSTHEFGFVRLADAWSTGSSIMPQKKNPDVAELARGKAGRLIGNLSGLLATLKGLPLAYNRDLQEDKEPVFDSVDQLLVLTPAMAGLVATLMFDTDRLAALAPRGFSLATDVADWLVRQRVPFAEAHDIAGAAVRFCEQHGLDLSDLTTEQLTEISPRLQPAVLEVLTVGGSIDSRDGRGGTATVRVREQLQEVLDRFDDLTAWLSAPLGPQTTAESAAPLRRYSGDSRRPGQ